ncbi:MAG: RNA polymerase factor sigma-54 [Bacteroidales bacterium]|nr:RNA polymerase factor sigma-54 [Bacteroidales bacterium]
MLSQKLQQKLLQKLSPQQIQLMKLLQIPTMELEQRIKQEIENNPALEEEDETDKDETTTLEEDDKNAEEENDDLSNIHDSENEFSIEDYTDEYEDYSTSIYKNQTEFNQDDKKKDIPFSESLSFNDYLISQLGMQILTDKQYQIGLHIIGNIDETGYLTRDIESMSNDLAFSQYLETNTDEITEILKLIQGFDPPGIAARNLQECLLLQLKRKEENTESLQTAKFIIENHFDDFKKKHYSQIQQKTQISEEILKSAIQEILKLNPKPGSDYESISGNNYIIPDFSVISHNGKLELNLSSGYIPNLRLNKAYLTMLESYNNEKKNNGKRDKEAMKFVIQKIDNAKEFINALKQREDTLFVTMEAIMNYQKEFFISGDTTKLKPMILKDISNMVGLDISTISRVANSKYVQTPFGIFQLKYFFSEGIISDTGEEVSTTEIKRILQECIEQENKKKPLKDDELTNILKSKGYTLARRTVAKYREQLKIPNASLRKQL